MKKTTEHKIKQYKKSTWKLYLLLVHILSKELLIVILCFLLPNCIE